MTNERVMMATIRTNRMFVTQPLSQRDPRWKDLPLGFSNLTIGSDGCTLTSITMIANGFGYTETPATLNDKLKSLGNGRGLLDARMVWAGPPRVLPDLRLVKILHSVDDTSMSAIDDALARGKPVLIELDRSPSPNFQNHWVVIFNKQGDDYLIYDPWTIPTRESESLITKYGFSGSPAQIIRRAIFYDNPNFNPPPPGSNAPPKPIEEELFVIINDNPDIWEFGGVPLREQPTSNSRSLKRIKSDEKLRVLEPAMQARDKIGIWLEWIHVRADDGLQGYVAAWLVHLEYEVEEPKEDPSFVPESAVALPVIERIQQPLRRNKIVSVDRSAKNAKLRQTPPRGKILASLKPGDLLEVIEPASDLAARVNKRGQWMRVRVQQGETGFVSSAFVSMPHSEIKSKGMVRNAARTLPPPERDVIPPDQRPMLRVISSVGLNLREAPSLSARIKLVLRPGEILNLREPLSSAKPKIGLPGQWIAVSTIANVDGFVAAQYVALVTTNDPLIIQQGVVITNERTPIFASPTSTTPFWHVSAGTPLKLMNPAADWSKVGNANAFIETQTYAFKRGFVRGSQVRAPEIADRRLPVDDAPLPRGICAWLYGVHDAYDRALFSGGKTGWVLFTERVVSEQGNMAYEDWAINGYGVIARLNNDYGGTGTIPVPSEYDRFARNCAEWVRRSRGCRVYVIGNEMNNPREWPEGGNNPANDITPELYAQCFNKVRAAIKSVQPNAIVVPGAVDPYQGPRMSCLDYFTRLMNAITDLDGIALHCYTHGYTPDLVTHMKTFDDDPLRWQYYHFRCYSTLIDCIPTRFRRKPIYLTETDAHGGQPWSGGQNGWVQAAYQEIQRYNAQPHAQQIQTAILYRWSLDDNYSLVDKPAVQADIRATIATTDFRWRG
jgi:hypothetical protein